MIPAPLFHCDALIKCAHLDKMGARVLLGHVYSFEVTRALWSPGVSHELAQPERAVFKAAEQALLFLSGHAGYLAIFLKNDISTGCVGTD